MSASAVPKHPAAGHAYYNTLCRSKEGNVWHCVVHIVRNADGADSKFASCEYAESVGQACRRTCSHSSWQQAKQEARSTRSGMHLAQC